MSNAAPNASPAVTSPATLPTASPTVILETRNYINQLSDYNSLSKCAESQVSAIVRNMALGCGDGGKMTSFACFCSSSSSEYDSLIGVRVRTACLPSAPAEESKARSLFNAYCQIPITAAHDSAPITVNDPGRITSATIHSTFSTQTSPTIFSPTSSSSNHTATNNSFPRTTIVALSVALPLLAVALAAIVFLIFSRQHKRPPPSAPFPCELQGAQAAELCASPTTVPEAEKAPPYHQVVAEPAPSPTPIQPPTSRYTMMDRKGGRDGGAVELDGSDMVFRGEKH